MAMYDSNDHEESTWTPRILIEEERGIGIKLREMFEGLNTE